MKRLPFDVEKFELLNKVMAVLMEGIFIASVENRKGTKLSAVEIT